MDKEKIERICAELMAPMLREFTKAVAEMREQGASEADIKAMLDQVEESNRGKVEASLLELMMTELRRVAQDPEDPSRSDVE
jgi:hypothetical protein